MADHKLKPLAYAVGAILDEEGQYVNFEGDYDRGGGR